MTKYLKRNGISGGVSYQPEGTNMFIPHDPMNSDYARMLEEVAASTSTIEEVDDT